MTSLLDAPPDVLGAQLPRVWSAPSYVQSTGDEAIELAAMAGLDLDPWQQFILTQSLGERADGKWSAFEVGVVLSRQNGKGGVLEARELAGLFLLGERLIIHSAHQFDTSLEAFDRLVALILDTPELRRRVRGYRGPDLDPRGISRSHGTEGVTLKSGQRIRFRTRTKGGGRGFTSDCLILDEAMIIPEAMHSALFPTLSARPNPQVWYTGSAVDQDIHEYGVVLARVRERGHKGDDPSLAYFEWSAADDLDEVTVELANDPHAWAVANPALGIRISSEYVANERRAFASNLKGFAVERLGVGDWPRTDDASDIITAAEWNALMDANSEMVNPVCFAFDVTPDRSRTSISVAGRRKDGLFHVEVIEHDVGTAWVAQRLAELKKAHRSGPVYFDASGPAASLSADLENAKIETIPVSAKEHGQACGMFYDSITDSKDLRHLGTPELAAALNGAKRRSLGDAWGWDRKNSAIDISPLVSSTLALYGCRKLPKRTSRMINLADVLAKGDAKAAENIGASESEPELPPNAGPFTRSRWTVS